MKVGIVSLSEWLRSETWNLMGSPRAGSNPAADVFLFTYRYHCAIYKSSIKKIIIKINITQHSVLHSSRSSNRCHFNKVVEVHYLFCSIRRRNLNLGNSHWKWAGTLSVCKPCINLWLNLICDVLLVLSCSTTTLQYRRVRNLQSLRWSFLNFFIIGAKTRNSLWRHFSQRLPHIRSPFTENGTCRFALSQWSIATEVSLRLHGSDSVRFEYLWVTGGHSLHDEVWLA